MPHIAVFIKTFIVKHLLIYQLQNKVNSYTNDTCLKIGFNDFYINNLNFYYFYKC